jgi:biotin-(acetyl-CoA carboxylase) ligase
LSITSVSDAIAVLNATCHRGARTWEHDAGSGRIMPAVWKLTPGGEPAPMLTVFEAVAIARGLAQIGAYQVPIRLPVQCAHG